LRRFLLSIAALLLFVAAVTSPAAASEAGSPQYADVRAACKADLEALPAYLDVNDAGVRSSIEQGGMSLSSRNVERYNREASEVTNDEQCDNVIRSYLRSVRRGHLELQSMLASHSGSDEPAARAEFRVTALDRDIAVMRLPSFDADAASQIGALLKQRRNVLRSHRSWIIDVRGNAGGSDLAWQSLMPYFNVRSTTTFGVEFLATPDNIQSTVRMLDAAAPGSGAVPLLQATVAKMRNAAPGSYVRVDERLGTRDWATTDYGKADDGMLPREVVVLVDSRCASSCEEFLLNARQSWRVKLFGQNSAGSLDFSNLRPHALPSERRGIWYATSRSLRLPALAVDGRGISPDIPYPEPTTPDDEARELRAAADFVRNGGTRH